MCCALPHFPVLLFTPAQAWFSDNEFWLVPYAAFCFLRDLFGTAEHWKWGTMAKPTPQVRQTHGVQTCTAHARLHQWCCTAGCEAPCPDQMSAQGTDVHRPASRQMRGWLLQAATMLLVVRGMAFRHGGPQLSSMRVHR